MEGVITSNGQNNQQIKRVPIGSYVITRENSKEFMNKMKQTQTF